MLINTASTVTNNTGVMAKKFTMQASGVAFEIISNSLYERKEEAVLRELSANAYDAHREVGKETTPIQITLPTELNPFLVVTDFGVGMSLPTVEDILTTYFASTKSTNNDDIGGFGLGFKSPFAISDSYTVKTIHKSIHTELIISLDNGEPTYIVVCNKPTTEPDGTTVTVPVDRQDVRNAIYTASLDLFTYWKTLPIVDKKQVEAINKTPLYDTEHFTVPASYWYRYNIALAVSKVLVGEFVYSIPKLMLDRISNSLSIDHKSKVDYFLKNAINRQRVIINTKIGELKVAPSRERIEDTDKNKKLLESKIISIIEKCNASLITYTQKAIDIIYDVVEPLTLAKYGVPLSVSKEIESRLSKELGVSLENDTLLNYHTFKDMDLGEETDYKLAHIYYLMGDTSLELFTDFLSNSDSKSFLYVIKHSSELKTIKVDSDRVTRKHPFMLSKELKNKDSSYTLYVMADLLSVTKKSRINKTITSSVDKSLTFTEGDTTHVLNSSNYLELGDVVDVEKFKKNLAYYIDNITIKYVTFDDIKEYLQKPTKKVNTSTGKRSKEHDIVVSKCVTDYSKTTPTRLATTVGELYKDRLYKDYLVVFLITSKYNNYYDVSAYLSLSLHKQKIILVEIPRKETTTARYKKFVETANTMTLPEEGYIKKVNELLLGNDIADVFITAKSLASIQIEDSSFYPPKYKKLIDKYGIKLIQKFRTNGMLYRYIEYVVPTVDTDSKAYTAYKLLNSLTSTEVNYTIKLLPKSLVKSAIAISLTAHQLKKE